MGFRKPYGIKQYFQTHQLPVDQSSNRCFSIFCSPLEDGLTRKYLEYYGAALHCPCQGRCERENQLKPDATAQHLNRLGVELTVWSQHFLVRTRKRTGRKPPISAINRGLLICPLRACRPGSEDGGQGRYLGKTKISMEHLRDNAFGHQVWETYEAILDACCNAWNAITNSPDLIRSIGKREWAEVKI
jgi:hypothetical protein